MDIKKNKQRYINAAHAMQTGVKWEMINKGDSEAATTPKHLRVGLNSCLADLSGLATLLMKKGIFTEEEYVEAMADAMEKERDRYQKLFPPNVTLV